MPTPTTPDKVELTFQQKVELFKQTATNPQAMADYAASRAEVVLPLIQTQSTIRAIFRVEQLPPGADARYDIPFEDIDCVFMMPHIGGIPTVQVEGSEMHVDTFGLDGGVEYQLDVARDGRFQVGQLATTLFKNKFIAQEELAGWNLIKSHAAVVPVTQQLTALDSTGGTTGTKTLNIFTVNAAITLADGIGYGGRKVTDIYMSPKRFGDLRAEVARFGLPEAMRSSIWNEGQGTDELAHIRFHRVYNRYLVDDNTAYAFTQKEGYFYGVMPVREELTSQQNPISVLEWKMGIIGRERIGMGVIDDKGLVVISFA